MHEPEPGGTSFFMEKMYDTQSILYIARDIRRMSHTYLAIHEFLIRESFQTKTPFFFLECTTLLPWKLTIQVIHMLMLVPLCTCA